MRLTRTSTDVSFASDVLALLDHVDAVLFLIVWPSISFASALRFLQSEITRHLKVDKKQRFRRVSTVALSADSDFEEKPTGPRFAALLEGGGNQVVVEYSDKIDEVILFS